ncbi:MAG: Shikimate kinase [Gammaproteobacteria bacterium]|jgi:shikimate kinase|nr:Shikimate kinase [Gammaproteobacteria bacterium]
MMKKTQNIFLIGPMGAGKTTVGRMLAKELKREFYDTDEVIESRTGVDIPWIFDVEGEEGFRQREMTVVDELTQKTGVVLATGGSVVIEVQNRTHLAARGLVIYLKTTVGQQLERTEKDKKRPLLLQATDREAVLRDIAVNYDELYREIADHVFVTDNRSIRAVVNDILSCV